MAEGIVVNFVPVALQEGRNQQEKGGLRLVEVGDHASHDMVVIARGDNDLRGGMEDIEMMLIHVGEERGEGVDS